ncbi:transmembrane protein 247 [Pongo abelii]|uniref:transmembrane protein 247 n=1 Tax=Pongo abelii TaxID=9601 RepID=UPI0023E89C8F|nr:transmembrane protein 247 [Pongo abelii]
MAAEDREMMEARGAGESCPTFPKMVPGDSKSEGKPRACLEAESQKPDSSYDYLEEMEACEDGGCQGPLKSLSPKSCPATKGQAGDGPKPAELPPAPGIERNPEMELEKVRMEFELTRLKYLHEENERQRQHEVVMEQLQRERQHKVVMEQLQQEAAPRLFSGGLQNFLLPQNQFAMFLYCFIFIHIIYVTKEMVFFLFAKHYLFCIAAILLCLIKTFWSYFQEAHPCRTPRMYCTLSNALHVIYFIPQPSMKEHWYNVIESIWQGIPAEAYEKHLRAGLGAGQSIRSSFFYIYPECPQTPPIRQLCNAKRCPAVGTCGS